MKPRKPIPRMSKAMAEKMKVYAKLRREFLKANPECWVCIDEWRACTRALVKINKTDDPHHKKGRGPNLLKVETWMAVCRAHHDWIGSNPREAMAKGYILSRLAKV